MLVARLEMITQSPGSAVSPEGHAFLSYLRLDQKGVRSSPRDARNPVRLRLLTAQYESWTLPVVIILIVPLCILFALLGVLPRDMDNNILMQIGFIVLIGLASNNWTLIVEFAKQCEDPGVDARQ